MRWGARHAALAAGLMAVMPLHVRESHYVLTDVPSHVLRHADAPAHAGRARTRARAAALPGRAPRPGSPRPRSTRAGSSIVVPLIAVWMTLGTKPSRLVGLARRPRRRRRRIPRRGPVHDPGSARRSSTATRTWPATTRRNAWRNPRGSPTTSTSRAAWTGRRFFCCSAASGWAPSAPSAVLDACDGRSRSPSRCSTSISCRARRWSSAATCCRSSPSSACWPPSARSPGSACCAASTSRVRRARPSSPRITAAALLPPAWQSLGFIRDHRAHEHDRAGPHLDPVGHPQGRVDRHRDPGAAALDQEVQGEERPTARPRLPGPGRLRRLRQGRGRLHRRVIPEVRRCVEPAEGFPELYDAYARLFGQSQEVMRFTPSAEHPGPEIRVFRLR